VLSMSCSRIRIRHRSSFETRYCPHLCNALNSLAVSVEAWTYECNGTFKCFSFAPLPWQLQV
jgi:hypothetical protein